MYEKRTRTPLEAKGPLVLVLALAVEVALETAEAVTDARRLWAVLKDALWAMVGRRGEREKGRGEG